VPLKPTREQIKSLVESDLEGPVVMLNLLKYAAKAAGEQEITGEESYRRYGDEVRAQLEKVGGKLLWRGRADSVVIGGEADEWDEVLLVEYPSRKAFLQMTGAKEYEKTGEHRTKALLDSRLIAMTERYRAP
jgi:uncharacterized protein (DUF1330 family)